MHPYYCYYSLANSLYDFSTGYNTAAAPTVAPPTVLLQDDLPRYFQPKIQDININIYNAIGKPKVFKTIPFNNILLNKNLVMAILHFINSLLLII